MNAAAAGGLNPRAARPQRWPAVRQVLLAAWQEHGRRSWLAWLLLALLLALPLVGLAHAGGAPRRLLSLVSVLLVVVAVGCLAAGWLMLVFNLMLQNHPQMARTVPGQVAALRLALLAAAAAVIVAGGWMAAALGGPFLPWALAGAAFCTAMAVAMRWPLLWLPLVMPLWAAPVWVDSSRISGLPALWQAWQWPLAAGGVLLAALLLRSVILGGGPRHLQAHARLTAMAAAMGGRTLSNDPRRFGVGLDGWFRRSGTAGYALWLRRLLAQPASPAPARLAMGMGPLAHWTGALVGNLAVTLMSLLFAVVTMQFPGWHMGAAMRSGLALGLTVSSMAMVVQLPAALWASRREQALLRLLPAARQGAALNRWLALRLSGIQLAMALSQMLALLLLAQVSDIDQTWPLTSAVGLATLSFSVLLVPALWRDWSTLRPPTGARSLQLVGAMVAAAAAGFCWVRWLGAPWWALGLLGLLLAAPLTLWRWHALGRLPAAWPAGRRAG